MAIKNYLIGGFNHFETYESQWLVDYLIDEMENKKCSRFQTTNQIYIYISINPTYSTCIWLYDPTPHHGTYPLLLDSSYGSHSPFSSMIHDDVPISKGDFL